MPHAQKEQSLRKGESCGKRICSRDRHGYQSDRRDGSSVRLRTKTVASAAL